LNQLKTEDQLKRTVRIWVASVLGYVLATTFVLLAGEVLSPAPMSIALF